MSQSQPMNNPPEILPKPARRRWRLWLGGAFLLFVLWLVIVYAFFVYWTDRRLREAMAAAGRDTPEGWQLEDIEARREKMPDDENAALVILKVKQLLPANWPFEITSSDTKQTEENGDSGRSTASSLTWDLQKELPPEVQLDSAMLRSLRESLARVQPARAEVRKLIGMTRGRFPLQWDDDILQTKMDSGDARIVTNLLHNEATLASQDGNADGAVAFVRGMLGAARAVGDEPSFVSAMVRLSCDAQAKEALERVLAQGEPSTPELEAVQLLLDKEASEPLFLRAVRGERAIMHKLLLSMRHGTTDLSDLQWLSGSPRPRKNFVDYFAPSLAQYAHGRFLDLMNQYVEAAKLPPEKQQPVMVSLEQKLCRRLCGL